MIRFEDVKPAPKPPRAKVANSPDAKVANKPKRDRKDYQRELMRKRRAKAKNT